MSNALNDSIYTSPKSWGPHFWFVMKCIAYNYPDNPTTEEKERVKKFYLDLQYLLPCAKCRKSYTEHIFNHPINHWLANGRKLFEWVNIIYKETNKNINANNGNANYSDKKVQKYTRDAKDKKNKNVKKGKKDKKDKKDKKKKNKTKKDGNNGKVYHCYACNH